MTIRFNNLALSFVTFVAFLILIIFGSTKIILSPSHPEEIGNEEEIAKKHGVTFPIPELGNCGSIADCRSFCEDPLNQQTCIDYAKSKGFYQESDLSSKKDQILSLAKSELGCDSEASCMALCSQPENYDQCSNFSQKHGLGGGHVEDPNKAEIISKAKEALGCDSASACASFCSQEANRGKCTEFAKEVGLRGGEHLVGPGGCISEQTCKAFCSDPVNFQVCRGFASSSGGKFTGPGGCSSEETCRAYCSSHEDECRSIGGGPGGGSPRPGYNPQEMCLKTPQCRWVQDNCQCGFYGTEGNQKRAEEYAKYCRENPDKCKPGEEGGFDSSKSRDEYERYCRENPLRCAIPSQTYQPYSTYQPSSTYQPYPQSSYSPYPGSGSTYDPATQCSQTAGCSWNGSSCQCSTTSGSGSYSPAPSGSSSTPPPSQTTTQTQVPSESQQTQTQTSEPQPAPSSGVQGVSSGRGLLQLLWDIISGK